MTFEAKRTISFHVDLQALGEPTCLALIAPRNVHDTATVLLANSRTDATTMISQISVKSLVQKNKTLSKMYLDFSIPFVHVDHVDSVHRSSTLERMVLRFSLVFRYFAEHSNYGELTICQLSGRLNSTLKPILIRRQARRITVADLIADQQSGPKLVKFFVISRNSVIKALLLNQ
ncbi:hypothetical protein WN51_11985 [Melipona quadrifasciata]|uniref:Uncharacterized protein n=1 Tax=Melipona quadrifasciata TaxID=166423 RepID=A0A0N1ITP9_9HYME|nr:hypothetical protein WN51_11985 [Melipona quadrifasciata]